MADVDPCIYPFLPDISAFLKSSFTGTKYEALFVGNFVDRTRLFDGDVPAHPVWDPLRAKEFPERRQHRRIYCTLVVTVDLVHELMQRQDLSKDAKHLLTMYLDMHIPLINHVQKAYDRQAAQLLLPDQPVLTPEFQRLLGTVSIKAKHAIKTRPPPARFDALMRQQPKLFTDDLLCTKVDDSPPVAVRLQPSQALFGTEIFHDGLLPDVLRHVINCNFFSESKQKSSPLVHLISKALPQRCTVRNLAEILHDYAKKHEYVYTFVIGCMKASLLGLYKHATVRPPFPIRRALIDLFRTKTKNEFLSWMLMGHQQLLFYIIKEFLVFSCRLIPSLYDEITARYSWGKFEEGVTMAMNNVRKYETFAPDDPLKFDGAEGMLAVVNKQQISNLYRPAKASFASTVLTECDRLDEERCVTAPDEFVPKNYKDLMYDIAVRTEERAIPFDLLKCFQIDQETITTVSNIQEVFLEEGSKGSLKQFLRGLERRVFETVRAFCDAYDRKMNVRIFDLPVHTYVQQCIALRRKHEVPNGVDLPEHVGVCQVCLNCKTFKSFINHLDNKGNAVNLYAYGHSKILVDPDAPGGLAVYCGKRCDKADGKKRHNYQSELSSFMALADETQQTQRAKKREAKAQRKAYHNRVCEKTELTRVSLLGRALQFYGKIYTICPSCGNPMAYSGKHFNGVNGFYCGCCLSPGGELFTTISCMFCKAIKNNETWVPFTVEGEGGRDQIYLCPSCFKPWIRDSTTLLNRATIVRGLTERWKRLKHPSN